MTLAYEWTWDFARLDTHTLRVVDGVGTLDVPIASGFFGHTAVTHRRRTYAALAAHLQAGLNVTPPRAYTVSYSRSSGYTISAGSAFELNLSATAAHVRMGTLLGLVGGTGQASYASTRRPLYLLLPRTQARSRPSDEYQPDDVATEAVTDGGATSQVSRYTSEVWEDWEQVGDSHQHLPSTPFAPGAPVFRRHESTLLPWSYQRGWIHQRDGHPFIVADGSSVTVHRIRAEGAAWRPTRLSDPDWELWRVRFATRLVGRVA